MNDTKAAKLNHERGAKHQENLQRSECAAVCVGTAAAAAWLAGVQHTLSTTSPSSRKHQQQQQEAPAPPTHLLTPPLLCVCLPLPVCHCVYVPPMCALRHTELRDMSRKADSEKKEKEAAAAAISSIEQKAQERFEADQAAAQEAAGKWDWMPDSQYYYNAKHRCVCVRVYVPGSTAPSHSALMSAVQLLPLYTCTHCCCWFTPAPTAAASLHLHPLLPLPLLWLLVVVCALCAVPAAGGTMTPKPSGTMVGSQWHGRRNQACPQPLCLGSHPMKAAQNRSSSQQQQQLVAAGASACRRRQQQRRQPRGRRWL